MTTESTNPKELFPFLNPEPPPIFYIVRRVVNADGQPIRDMPRVTGYAVQWCAKELVYFVQHVWRHHADDCYLRGAIKPRLVDSLDPPFVSSLLTWVQVFERDRPAFCARAKALQREVPRIFKYRHADVHAELRRLLEAQ